MDPASAAQERTYSHLMDAKHGAQKAVAFLEKARDELNREYPARHVAIAITEVETGTLWIDKALYELTSAVFFSPADRPEDA